MVFTQRLPGWENRVSDSITALIVVVLAISEESPQILAMQQAEMAGTLPKSQKPPT
jgi:hypothetical protein